MASSKELENFAKSLGITDTELANIKKAMNFAGIDDQDVVRDTKISVRYYYKPQTKYPPRIFMLFDDWCRRNLKPMGIMNARCLLHRYCTRLEQIDCKLTTRYIYRYFEDWDDVIEYHREEGVSSEIIKKLCDLRNSGRYTLLGNQKEIFD